MGRDPAKGKGHVIEGVGEFEAPTPRALEKLKLGENDKQVNNPVLRRQQSGDCHLRLRLSEIMHRSEVRPRDLTHIRGDQQFEEVSSQRLEGQNEQENLTWKQICEILSIKDESGKLAKTRKKKIGHGWWNYNRSKISQGT